METSMQAPNDVVMIHLSKSMSLCERRKHLRNLFATLSPYELREFRQWIDQVDFRCDLLTKLPLEIMQHVLGYLPLHQCFRMRRVSKKWLEVLSKPKTVEHLLRFWYPKAEAKFEVPNELGASAASSLRAEHVDAYRSGQAFNTIVLDWDLRWELSDRHSITKNVAYSNGWIARIDRTRNICLYHLESATNTSCPFGDGQTFSQIAMSSSVLAGITLEATCRVTTLADKKNWEFALPSKEVETMTASASAVAILYKRSSENSMEKEMTIWTLRSKIPIQCLTRPHHLSGGQKSQREKSQRDKSQRETKIMIGAKIDYVVVFEEYFDDRWRIYFARFGFDGQLQSQGSLQAPDAASLAEPLRSSISLDSDESIKIWSYCHSHAVENSDSLYIDLTHVQYDPQQDRLQLKTNRIVRKLWYQWPINPKSIFIWKDIAYYVEPDNMNGLFPELRMIDLSENETKCTVNMGEYHQPGFGSYTIFPFFGDENFLLSVCGRILQAWSFSKDVKITGGMDEYALHRRQMLDERLERQRARDAYAMARLLRREQISLEVTGSVGNYLAFQQTESYL